MPQLDPTWFASQLFWLAVTFVLLYVILSRFVLPPLQDIIARRQQTVEGDLSLAQSLKSQAEQARQDYERTLAEARNRAQALMNEAIAAHKAKSEMASKEMDRQIELKLAEASRRIAAKKEEMISALTPTTTELTAMIVEKLTQHSPSNDQVSRIITNMAKGRR
jgi:F-type H+-transporting ATPase subunit b